jgi:hypothetical protein
MFNVSTWGSKLQGRVPGSSRLVMAVQLPDGLEIAVFQSLGPDFDTRVRTVSV